jgi:serine/threonine-protein kinase RsbW
MQKADPEARGSAPLASDPTPVHLRVLGVADQVATVRHAVLESAKAHGIGSALLDDIALAVSEACTNVVLHAYRGAAAPGPLAVDAYRENGAFFVVVCDEGAGISPRTDSPGLGLGLGLIGGLAQRLEISSHDPVGAKLTMVFAAPARERTTARSGRGEVEKPSGMDAPGRNQEVRMQPSAQTTTSPRALSATEREWIRQQGRVSRAIEAAQRRRSGRFSRVTTPPGATRPGVRTNRRAPA